MYGDSQPRTYIKQGEIDQVELRFRLRGFGLVVHRLLTSCLRAQSKIDEFLILSAIVLRQALEVLYHLRSKDVDASGLTRTHMLFFEPC